MKYHGTFTQVRFSKLSIVVNVNRLRIYILYFLSYISKFIDQEQNKG